MKKFKQIFVVEPSNHDMRGLTQYGERILFMTAGLEPTSTDIHTDILLGLQEQKFNPQTDAVVPVGRIAAVMIAGIVLGRHYQQPITVALYQNSDYVFMNLPLGA